MNINRTPLLKAAGFRPELNMRGYLHPVYANSFIEFGIPTRLPNSGAWILVRDIPGHPGLKDAMAVYPFLCCESWENLKQDLDEIDNLVSLTAVPDPFGDYDKDLLRAAFPDCFKDKYKLSAVADLTKPYGEFVSNSRRKAAIKALKKLTIEFVEDPSEQLEEFSGLYDRLIARHDIKGMRAFSKNVFDGLLRTPGLVYVRAKFENKTIGVHTWVVQNGVSYAHLAAYDLELGYKMYAPSALYWSAFDYFIENKVRWLFYGGSATGAATNDQNNLINFKKGWESDVHQVYLCGRIFQPEVYAKISKGFQQTEGGYFPTYRQGEFA